jgi:hypothetical protein
LNTLDLFDNEGHGVEIFGAVMSRKRFLFLLRCLRFDDRTTREQRCPLDRLALIRELFDRFVKNCQQNYSPGENVTIDEKLEGFRGRCGFVQYIPSKPRKYGIKIYALVDSEVFYASNLEIYAGAQPENTLFSVSNKPVDIVRRLSGTILNSGHNITADNRFSDISLAEELCDVGLSFVGTLKKNKVEIPMDFKDLKGREVNSSMFGFHKKCTLVSYVPKVKKNVLLISTMHNDSKIDQSTGVMKKPEIITYCNKIKGGVDTNDQMCETYSVSRNTKRWPMVVFFSMLNMAGINSQVLLMGNCVKTCRRRRFLKSLGEQLVQEQLQRRQSVSGIHLHLQQRIRKMHDTLERNNNPETIEEHECINDHFSTLAYGADIQPINLVTTNQPENDLAGIQLTSAASTSQSQAKPKTVQSASATTNQPVYDRVESLLTTSAAEKREFTKRTHIDFVNPHEDSCNANGDNRKKCAPCKRAKKWRNTKFQCTNCGQALCLEHCHMLCSVCLSTTF